MEFCPVCMLRRGLAGEIESGESSASEDIGKPTQGVEIIVRVKASAARASAARASAARASAARASAARASAARASAARASVPLIKAT
jgi:hypothetical protein